MRGGKPGGGGGGEGGIPVKVPSQVTIGMRRTSVFPESSKKVCAVNSKYAEPSSLACTTSNSRMDAPSPETKTASGVCPTRCSSILLPKSKRTTTPATCCDTATATSKRVPLAYEMAWVTPSGQMGGEDGGGGGRGGAGGVGGGGGGNGGGGRVGGSIPHHPQPRQRHHLHCAFACEASHQPIHS